MGRKAVVIRPEIAPGRRVLAVSDIHGNLPFLKGLLEQAAFSPADVLILDGDLLEKGNESLATLRYVMELGRTHTVYPLCGNCDHIDRAFLEGRPGIDRELLPVFRFWKERALVNQMGAQLGLPCVEREEDMPPLRAAIRAAFPEETAFLLGLPHILEAGNFIFVHGGVPREDALEELDAYGCMKNDDFLGQGRSFRKWVVAGHWPVTLYHPHVPNARPLILRERHIASIDGGCVLKIDGQLNALVIPDVYGEEMGYTAYDGLPRVTALDPQAAAPDRPLNIRWSDSAVDVLRREGDCAWCRHRSTGRELWIPGDYLFPGRKDGLTHTEDTTDCLLAVSPGDRLSLVGRYSRGLMVKRDGASGWYLGRVRPEAGEGPA